MATWPHIQRLTPCFSVLITVTTLLLLPGPLFAGGGGSHAHAPSEQMERHSAPDHDRSFNIIQGVDWLQAERLSVKFEDNLFEPEQVILKIGKPYIIRMRNTGGDNHDMEGERFFSSVVVRELRTTGIRMAAYHLESLYLKPGHEVEVWLVPVKEGHFTFVCTLPGHLEDGMEGGFLITP